MDATRPSRRERLLAQVATRFDDGPVPPSVGSRFDSGVPLTQRPVVLVLDGDDADWRGRWVLPERPGGGGAVFTLPEPPAGSALPRTVRLLVPIEATAAPPERAEGLRLFTPDTNHLAVGDPAAVPAASAAPAGPWLLLVPDALGTARTSFDDLRGVALDRLADRYDGRVLAYEHHTLVRTPEENARHLRAALVEAGIGRVDVLAHGRGGLVARELLVPEADHVQVGRLVCAGTPHHGTPLCDPGRLPRLVDRWTDLLSLVPVGGFEDALATLLAVLDAVARDPAVELPGLAAMATGNARLGELQRLSMRRGPTLVACIGSTYRPDGGLARVAAADGLGVLVGDHDGVVPLRSAVGADLAVDVRASLVDPASPDHSRYCTRTEIVDALLAGSRGRGIGEPPAGRRGTRPERTTGLEVTVAHCSLEYARFPIMVGNYQGSDLSGVQSLLDMRLGGRLSARHTVNAYPGALGESLFLVNTGDLCHPPGVYVVGLGDDGSLDREGLAFTVARALVQRCLPLLDDPEGPLRAEVGVSSLLLGSFHGRGLPVASSVHGIIDGVLRANAILEQYAERVAGDLPRLVRIGALQFVERYADRAEVAVRAVRDAPARLGLPQPPYDFSKVELGVRGQRGGLPAEVVVDEASEQDRRLDVLRWQPDPLLAPTAAAPPDDRRLVLDISVSGQGARVDKIRHVVDPGLVAVLTQAVREEGVDSDVAATLYDMLVPIEVEQRLGPGGPTTLVVDEATANLPWELICAPRFGQRASAGTSGGVIRRFVETGSSRPRGMWADQMRALVVGASHVAGWPPLSGVSDEVAAVAELLGADHDTEVVALIDSDTMPIDPRRFLRELFGEHRIVHIASHGHFREDGLVSEAVLGTDLRLTAELLRHLRVIPELVFLNCCEVGQIGSTRLAAGLARELMALGVRAVVAAGWSVGDRPAVAFARAFYEAMMAGQRFADAVVIARYAAAGAGSDDTWAAYQCYGEPGFRLRGSRQRRGGVVPVPASLGELLRNVDAIRVQASDTGRSRADEVTERLRPLREELGSYRELVRANPDYDGRADVQRRLADAARELGLFGWATHAYRAVVAITDHARGRDFEQLANMEARLAQMVAEHRVLAVDEVTDELRDVDALFRAAEAHVTTALRLGESRERLAVLGSVHKRWAIVDEAHRREHLRAAAAAYRAAVDLTGYSRYGIENARQLHELAGLPEAEVPAERPEDDRLPPGRRYLDECAERGDFWSMADRGDRALTRLVLARDLDEPDAAADQLVAVYRRAFTHRSSVSERDTVLSHLRAVRAFLPEGDPRRRALERALDGLGEWDPWAEPATAPAVRATIGAPAVAATPGRTRARIELRMLPAGPGDALLVSFGPADERFRILIDGGLRSSFDEGVAKVLAEHGRGDIDLLVVTHVDADHVQGATDAVASGALATAGVWFNGTEQVARVRSIKEGLAFDNLTLGPTRNAPFRGDAVVVRGGSCPVARLPHGAVVTFLSPDEKRLQALGRAWLRAVGEHRGAGTTMTFEGLEETFDGLGEDRGEAVAFASDRSVTNGSSIAFLLEHAGAAVLLAGDAHAGVLCDSISALLQERRANRLRLDAFKLPHHGSARNVSARLLDLVECDHFLVSTDGSRHGHPHAETIELIRSKHPSAWIHCNYDTPEVRERTAGDPNVVFPTDGLGTTLVV